MTTQGTTQRPERPPKTVGTTFLDNFTVSPIGFIRKVTERYPYLTLKPESSLAVAAMIEYQQALKATSGRPPWPADICGYLESLSAAQLDSIDRRTTFNYTVSGISDLQYEPDSCLSPVLSTTVPSLSGNGVPYRSQFGISQPGSNLYDKCRTEQGVGIEDLYNADWATYFTTPAYPGYNDLSDDQREDIFNSVEATLEAAEEANAAIAEGNETTLWKPIDHTGSLTPDNPDDDKAVILISASFPDSSEVALTRKDNTAIEKGRFTSRYEDNRPIYRLNRAGRDYTDLHHITVSVGGLRWFYNVSDPAKRQEWGKGSPASVAE